MMRLTMSFPMLLTMLLSLHCIFAFDPQASLHSPDPVSDSPRPGRAKGARTLDSFLLFDAAPKKLPRSECAIRESKSIFIFGKCPEKEEPLTTAFFLECASHIQFGCELQPTHDGKGICTLNKEKLEAEVSEKVVCPGDKVIFNNVNLKTFESLSYSIDLRAPPLMTDVYILVDATGSMGSAIAAAKANAHALLNVFSDRPNVAFGLGYYRDEGESGMKDGFTNAQAITTSKNHVTAQINKLDATGGGDADEANLVALYKVATDRSIRWRAGSRKIVIYFGDYPGHEPTCVSGKKLDRHNVADALKHKGITVVAIDYGLLDKGSIPYSKCGYGTKKGSGGQLSKIVEKTNGVKIKRGDQTRLLEQVRTLAAAMPRVYSYDDSGCFGRVKSNHVPSLPHTLNPGESQPVHNTLELQKGVCAYGTEFDCKITYTEGGAKMKATDIAFFNLKGC